ncbi:hypothetical protein [Streptomyces sp. VNUA24]|uniref:hypothetical protein n=1 Tax=Streptomyces sp. VNUA24 TaxID=3031131 RepID=UPI0023B86BD2|nr:hypothetical protein [Streptomyces sp. VNUA24]WEH16866.1 hypothetical protein PYR72_25430 [Streptomyces sp. VNUA24]
MKRDPLLWAALVAVLVVLASAEYRLAVACGFGQYVAAGVPAALDVYALAALRARRDVLAVVAVLIGVNAASHLVEVGLLPVDVPLVVAVSAVAPLVLWRVHRLGGHHQEPAPAPAVSAVPEAYPPVEVQRDTPAPEPVEQAPVLPVLGPFASLEELPRIRPYPAAYPPAEQEEHERAEDAVSTPDTDSDTPDTLPLPPGYARADGAEDDLTERARTDFAQLLADGRAPSIRSLRDTYSIGQPRAQRIQAELVGS